MRSRPCALLFCLGTVMLATGTARSPAQASHRIGVLGGAAIAKLAVDPEEAAATSNRTGFAAGGVLDLAIDERVSVVFEPMVIQKGTDFELTLPDTVSGEIKITYLAVPALVKIAFGDGGLRPYIMSGGEIGIKLDGKREVGGAEDEIDEDIKDIEFAVGLGGGIDFGGFFVEGRYTVGLSDINDSSDPGFEGLEIKTRTFLIAAGVTFAIGD